MSTLTHQRWEEITRLLEAHGRMTTRQIYDKTDLFENTTQVSALIHQKRGEGLLVTDIEGSERLHRLPQQGEAPTQPAARDEPATKPSQAPIAKIPDPAPEPAPKPKPEPEPEPKPEQEPDPQPLTCVSDIASAARRLVDERVLELGDDHLLRLIALERAACAVQGDRP